MKVSLSPAEAGVILYALESVYQKDSPEIQHLAQHLYDLVYLTLGDVELYEQWVKEFDLSDSL